jgi:hypothetical protein
MIKRSKLLEEIATLLHDTEGYHASGAKQVLEYVEQYLEPIVRPLTDAEVEEHVLVKQVHDSRKDEVRNYVRNLEYEWKREYLPEDKK